MKILLFVIFLLISFCKFVFSDEHLDEQQIIDMGDVEYGQYLGAECASCHHQSGASEGIPSIHGMDAEVFVALMLAYRSKDIENPVMQMIAGRLNDEQIGSLALYFSGLEPSK
jgi:cytochrome c